MRKGRTSEAARQRRLANHHGKKELLLTIGETAMSSGAEVPVYGQVTMAPFGARPLGLDALSRYEALLSVSRAIARHTSVAGLLRAIGDQLHLVVPFDYLMLILHDASTDEMRLVVLEPSNTPFVPFVPMLLSDWGPARSAWETQRTSVVPLLTEALLGSGLDVIRGQGARVTCWLPLTTAHRRVGVLSFGSRDADRYGADAVAFMEQVAAHVAIAVDNAINFDDAQRLQGELRGERDRLRLLLDVNNLLVSRLDYPDLLQTLSESLQRVVKHDSASVALVDRESGQLRLQALTYHDARGVFEPHLPLPLDASPAGITFASGVARIFRQADLDALVETGTPPPLLAGPHTVCCLPLVTRQGCLGTLNVASADPAAFAPAEFELLKQISSQLAIAVENALAYQEIRGIKDQLAEEKQYLEAEIRLAHDFRDIIGDSAAIKRVLQAIETVAPTDSTVLLRGETGTGKELLARAIHDLSPRREHTFVRLSLAALPVALIESELFGYEKGAFTGATTAKIGRLELAHRGTLFLDEVGDIPPEVQPKLLRVLQEREFERLGSTRTQRVDVRVIAATNRDLEQMVADGVFRQDLYYRLNVFPIQAPALRDRREDIPALVHHFVQKFAARLKRPITTIPMVTMDALGSAFWPGNIRELENVIERAVILSAGTELKVPLADLRPTSARNAVGSSAAPGQLRNAERELILGSLRKTRGVIGGPQGAAVDLGLKRTTLQSRMRRLGITRPLF
jgi:formate hydrogenlyase transcriptional activator